MSDNNNDNKTTHNNLYSTYGPPARKVLDAAADEVVAGNKMGFKTLLLNPNLSAYMMYRTILGQRYPEYLEYFEAGHALRGAGSQGGAILSYPIQALKSIVIRTAYEPAMTYAITQVNNRLKGKENPDEVTDDEMRRTRVLLNYMAKRSQRYLFDPESLAMVWYLGVEMEKALKGQANHLEGPLKEILGIDLVTVVNGQRRSAFEHVDVLLAEISKRTQDITLTEEEESWGLTLQKKRRTLIRKIFRNEFMVDYICGTENPPLLSPPFSQGSTLAGTDKFYTAEEGRYNLGVLKFFDLTPQTMLTHYAICFIIDPNYKMMTPGLQHLALFVESLGLRAAGMDKSMLWVFVPTESTLENIKGVEYEGRQTPKPESWDVLGAPKGEQLTLPQIDDPIRHGLGTTHIQGHMGPPTLKRSPVQLSPMGEALSFPGGTGGPKSTPTPPPGTIISYHPGPYPGGMVPDYLTRTPEQQQPHWEGHDLIAAAQHRDYPNLGVPAEQLYPPPTIRTQTNITLTKDIHISAPNLDTRGLGEQEVRGTLEGAFKDMVDPNGDPPFLG